MALFLGAATMTVNAQSTYEEMELLTVNEQVTTVITATEPIRFVDISTDKIAGDQPINNTIRIKPKDAGHKDGEILAIITVVTERYRVQYGLIYTTRLTEAVTDKTVEFSEQTAYNNPAVSLSTEDMYSFARKVWNSPAKYRNVGSKKHKLKMRLNRKRCRTTTPGSFSETCISNGTSAMTAGTSVRIHSGKITAHGAWVRHTNPAFSVERTITAISVWAVRSARTPTRSSAGSMPVMSIAM